MRRVFWFLLGIGVAVFVITRGKELLRRLTPAGVSEQVAEKGKDAAERARSFWTVLTESMDEREAELRTELNMAPSR